VFICGIINLIGPFSKSNAQALGFTIYLPVNIIGHYGSTTKTFSNWLTIGIHVSTNESINDLTSCTFSFKNSKFTQGSFHNIIRQTAIAFTGYLVEIKIIRGLSPNNNVKR